MKPRKALSVFSLTMINIIAIDSLRNLPVNAAYGSSIIFFYLLGTLFFFIPSALITAELATQWPLAGGSYAWVRLAFGKSAGFLNIWLQWVYNVVWYPTILSFIATSLAYLIDPALVDHKLYMILMIIGCFSIATLLNMFGMKVSAWISEGGAILGTILPMVLMIILGLAWLGTGHPSQIHWGHFLPDHGDWQKISFLVVVLFSLLGIEMSSVHATEVRHPRRDYPRALLISAVFIVISMTCASLAIALVVPVAELSVLAGINQAFASFLSPFHLAWMLPIVEVLIIIGGFAGLATWVIGPVKGLMVALEENGHSQFFVKRNRFGSPFNMLLLQAGMVILLCVVFVISPTVNSAYWLLTDLTAQLSLIYYMILFAAAIRLRFLHPERPQAFVIPGGKPVLCLLAGAGMLSCLLVMILGFLPPTTLSFGSTLRYEATLLIGMLLLLLPPLVGMYFLRRDAIHRV